LILLKLIGEWQLTEARKGKEDRKIEKS
jgi:hypothetical protein